MSITPSALGRPAGAKGEDTRQRVIAATMKCVAEVGYSRATIREIARTAQVTSGSLYHYFPNKAELVKATFLELAEIAVPRLTAAADRTEGVIDKLIAVFDESDQLVHDYPYAVAFDRAIRVESPDDLHLTERSDTIFGSLHDLVTDIIGQAHRAGGLAPEVDIETAANAIYALMQGLYDYTVTASSSQYHATAQAMKMLISGTLFDHAKLA